MMATKKMKKGGMVSSRRVEAGKIEQLQGTSIVSRYAYLE